MRRARWCPNSHQGPGRRLARITFEDIPQPWLKALAKRWARWRPATGLGVVSVSSGTRAIAHFGQFLADVAPSVQGLADLDRDLLECAAQLAQALRRP
ncbi:hypothetical protein BXY47_2027 [Dietzia kunjamensis]|nr:hypothetical protein BXY47_2027 [Dietzia kunjamensis]